MLCGHIKTPFRDLGGKVKRFATTDSTFTKSLSRGITAIHGKQNEKCSESRLKSTKVILSFFLDCQ